MSDGTSYNDAADATTAEDNNLIFVLVGILVLAIIFCRAAHRSSQPTIVQSIEIAKARVISAAAKDSEGQYEERPPGGKFKVEYQEEYRRHAANITLSVTSLLLVEDKRCWKLEGFGFDEQGRFTLSEGLICETGRAYWVAHYDHPGPRTLTLSQGTFDFLTGTFQGTQQCRKRRTVYKYGSVEYDVTGLFTMFQKIEE